MKAGTQGWGGLDPEEKVFVNEQVMDETVFERSPALPWKHCKQDTVEV